MNWELLCSGLQRGRVSRCLRLNSRQRSEEELPQLAAYLRPYAFDHGQYYCYYHRCHQGGGLSYSLVDGRGNGSPVDCGLEQCFRDYRGDETSATVGIAVPSVL
jgi:hypothetical protein